MTMPTVDREVRQDVADVLVRYASGIDRRDWPITRIPPSANRIGMLVTRVPIGSWSLQSGPWPITSPTNSWPAHDPEEELAGAGNGVCDLPDLQATLSQHDCAHRSPMFLAPAPTSPASSGNTLAERLPSRTSAAAAREPSAWCAMRVHDA